MERRDKADPDDDANALEGAHVARGLARHGAGPGRVGTYAMLGAAAGSVPLPWLPDAVARRVRGALAQDIAARHGLSITREARDLLAEPAGTEGPRGIGGQALRFFTRRVLGRFGPLAMVGPLRGGLETFVLGHLLSRYLDGARLERAARIDVEEARVVRRAIDRALILSVSPEVHASVDTAPRAPEELRDAATQMLDGVLITVASAPEWILRRLEAAFDEAVARER